MLTRPHRALLAWGFTCAALAAASPSARAFEIVSTAPARYALHVPPGLAEIRVVFDEAPALPAAAKVRVAGSMSGLRTGSLSVDGNALVFAPGGAPFFVGEMVNVNLRSDLLSADGDPLPGGRFFAFTIATAPASAQWGARQMFEASDIPYFIYGGDLDGDGTPDVAAPNEGTGDVSVFLNAAGTGWFPVHSDYGVGAVPSCDFGEDFDNDGDIDLATADVNSGTMSVLLNNGDGTFAPRTAYAVGNPCRQVHGGDMDGDNDVDLCATHVGLDRIFVFRNNGSGSFSTLPAYTGLADGPFTIRTADLDGDYHLDIAVGCQNADSLQVLRNTGAGSFVQSGRYRAANGPWDMNGNDLDGDGDVDFAIACANGSQLAVLYNNGAGAFPTRLVRNTPSFPLGIFVADLDGDADMDVTSSNYAGGNVAVFHNDGTGTVTLDTLLGVNNSGSYTWAHDLDGDGDLDLSVVDENDDHLFIFFNTGSPATAVEIGVASHPDAAIDLELRPDPARAGTSIVARVRAASGPCALDLYSVEGRHLRALWRGPAAPEGRDIAWEARSGDQALAAGTYVVTFTAGNERVSRTVRVLR